MNSVLHQIRQLALKYNSIQKVILFGSRARGDNTSRSDYDIAVFGGNEQEQFLFANDIDELSTLSKIDLLFVKERLYGMPIYQNIMKEGIVIMDKFQNKLENYEKALARLQEAIIKSNEDGDLVVRDGVIQRFEFTAELAWKTTREYLLQQGETDINSPKPVMRAAYRTELIDDDAGWSEILNDRNTTSHVYDDAEADDIYRRIKDEYVILFEELLEKLKGKA